MNARALAGAVAVALIAGVAHAQGPPLEGTAPGAAREEAGRMVDAYVLSNLQESLGLSDDQFVKLLPLVKRLQAERRETMERRSRALREMRRLLKSGSATEPEVLAQLKEFKAIETDEPARGRKDMEAIDGLLTPLQQAKFRRLRGRSRAKAPRADGPDAPAESGGFAARPGEGAPAGLRRRGPFRRSSLPPRGGSPILRGDGEA